MEISPMEMVSFGGVIIALGSAAIAYRQAGIAQRSAKQASLERFYSGFALASQATIANPELMFSVHGLDKSTTPSEEAKNIAYLSALLDSFQHFYETEYGNNFKRMAAEFKNRSTFLNRILAVKENQERWNILQKIYYGEFDTEFIEAIDSLIKYINRM